MGEVSQYGTAAQSHAAIWLPRLPGAQAMPPIVSPDAWRSSPISEGI